VTVPCLLLDSPIEGAKIEPFAFPLGHFPWWVAIVLIMVGLYAMIARGNLIKKVIGATLFQAAVFLFYLAAGKIDGATAPIVWPEGTRPHDMVGVPYENAVPHVLMLTGIVVGVATSGVALALIVRIWRAYGTIEEDEILATAAAE
jgi:multicomponent Na+:H+ antiporter subunit C